MLCCSASARPTGSFAMRTTTDPATALDFLARLENVPRWDPGTKSAQTSPGEPMRGTLVFVRWPTIQMQYEVAMSGDRITFLSRSADGLVNNREEMRVTPDGSGGSNITYEIYCALGGWRSVMLPVLRWQLVGDAEAASRGLSAALSALPPRTKPLNNPTPTVIVLR